ncbi:MAG: hypothetical protein AAF993_07405 [Pseudomonadota bacterium]
MDLRFNHMELTIPKGTLTDEWIGDFEAFYGDVFGWSGKRWRSLGGYLVDAGDNQDQFLLVVDAEKHLQSPGMDHLGLHGKSREHILEMWDKVQRWKAKDDRVETVDQYEFDTGRYLVTAFYVKYLLPIYFDVMFQGPREEVAAG